MTPAPPEDIHRSMVLLLNDAKQQDLPGLIHMYCRAVIRWRIEVLRKQEKS